MTCRNISYFNPEFQGNNHSLKEVMLESLQAKTKKMHLKNGFSVAFKKQVLTEGGRCVWKSISKIGKNLQRR